MSTNIVNLDLFDGESFKLWQKKPSLSPRGWNFGKLSRYLAQNKYAKVIGNLMYAMTCTRPDIAYAVGRLSRHTSSLGKEHWDAFQALAKETLVESRKCLMFGNDDFIRSAHIFNAIPDPLLYVYQNYPTTRELWKALEFQALVKETLVESCKCLKFGNDNFIDVATSSMLFRIHSWRYIKTIPLLENLGKLSRYLAQNKYAKVIGNLMYAMTCTRPDIAYAVGRLSRHTSSPGLKHWDAENRVFKYLKKTMDYGLEYSGDPLVLEGYTDASWITDQEDYVSTSG
ncbi:hypothetical protein Tco_0221691 [Tanacetum coccineum]